MFFFSRHNLRRREKKIKYIFFFLLVELCQKIKATIFQRLSIMLCNLEEESKDDEISKMRETFNSIVITNIHIFNPSSIKMPISRLLYLTKLQNSEDELLRNAFSDNAGHIVIPIRNVTIIFCCHNDDRIDMDVLLHNDERVFYNVPRPRWFREPLIFLGCFQENMQHLFLEFAKILVPKLLSFATCEKHEEKLQEDETEDDWKKQRDITKKNFKAIVAEMKVWQSEKRITEVNTLKFEGKGSPYFFNYRVEAFISEGYSILFEFDNDGLDIYGGYQRLETNYTEKFFFDSSLVLPMPPIHLLNPKESVYLFKILMKVCWPQYIEECRKHSIK